MAQLIRKWVMPCEQCIRRLRVDRKLTHTLLQNPNEYITAPEDAMQIDSLPELPPSGGYQIIVTAMTLHLTKTPNQLRKSSLIQRLNTTTNQPHSFWTKDRYSCLK